MPTGRVTALPCTCVLLGGGTDEHGAPVTEAGKLPEIGQAPPHAAEAAPRRRPTTAVAWVTVAASTAR